MALPEAQDVSRVDPWRSTCWVIPWHEVKRKPLRWRREGQFVRDSLVSREGLEPSTS